MFDTLIERHGNLDVAVNATGWGLLVPTPDTPEENLDKIKDLQFKGPFMWLQKLITLDQNHPDKTAYCAMAKRFATDVGFKVCNEALQMHGGYGYLREYPIERFLRDARVHQILEGTNEIMRVITARRLLQDGAMEEIR
jgi:alkylation response protein AidB-like acyl-CoA dehydrogenase